MGVSKPAPKDSSTDVTSFFKIMIGDDFSEVMFLPPLFAKTVTNLIGHKIQLEDANGLKWTITLSKYKGNLAFQKGWHAFSVDHGLKIGEFLVFNCVKHAHFLVKIYGRSGCEKLPVTECEERNRKRKRTNEKSYGRNKRFHETDSDNVTSDISIPNIEVNQSTPMEMDKTSNIDDGNNSKVFSKTICTEEPFFMMNRDFGVRQGEHRDSLYDLEIFEIRPSLGPRNGIFFSENKVPHEENAKIPNFVPKVSTSREIPEVPKLETMQKSRDVEQKDEKSTPIQKNDSKNKIASGPKLCSNKGKEHFSVSQKQDAPVRMSDQSLKKKIAGEPKNHYTGPRKSLKPVKEEQVEMKAGKSLKNVKQEQVELKEGTFIHGGIPGYEWIMKMDEGIYLLGEADNHVFNEVKAEPVEIYNFFSTVSAKIPSPEAPKKQTYLELPDKLLPVSSKIRQKGERKVVVYLRGPVSNVLMWPVLYYEKFGLKILSNGWEAFSNANKIGPGDECVFGLEDSKELIFRVIVIRK